MKVVSQTMTMVDGKYIYTNSTLTGYIEPDLRVMEVNNECIIIENHTDIIMSSTILSIQVVLHCP